MEPSEKWLWMLISVMQGQWRASITQLLHKELFLLKLPQLSLTPFSLTDEAKPNEKHLRVGGKRK